MARPERNSVDYFPFICEEGKKMFYIEQTYGNDGFAVFVKLLRELAKTDFHYLDLQDKSTLMFLSAKCKVSVELLISIINDLAELGKFNKELWFKNRIIWCQDFIDSIQDAYIRRNNKCITFEGLCMRLNIKCSTKTKLKLKKDDNNTQSILYYKREEESKENNSSYDNDNVIDKNWRNSFEIYQKSIREAYKEFVNPEFIKEQEIYYHNIDVELSIKKAIKEYWITEKGWKKRKASKTKELDWKATFINILKQKENRIYKAKTFNEPIPNKRLN